MKRILFLLGAFALLGAALTFVGSILQQDTIVEAMTAQFRFLCVSFYAFFGSIAFSLIEGSVYGGWKLEIIIDGQKIELEDEDLEIEDMKGILKFKGGFWVALATGVTPKLKKNRNLERLLRDCFESTGEIKGDPRSNVTIEEGRRLVLRLTEDRIARKERD